MAWTTSNFNQMKAKHGDVYPFQPVFASPSLEGVDGLTSSDLAKEMVNVDRAEALLTAIEYLYSIKTSGRPLAERNKLIQAMPLLTRAFQILFGDEVEYRQMISDYEAHRRSVENNKREINTSLPMILHSVYSTIQSAKLMNE